MVISRLRLYLPLIVVPLVLSTMLYGPTAEHWEVFRTLKFGNIAWQAEHFPMPLERVASALNFPAMTINYAFDRFSADVYSGWVAHRILVLLKGRDCTYLVCTAIFWWWIGTIWDRRIDSMKATKRRWFVVAESSFGILLGLLCGAYAYNMFIMYKRPMRQIAAGGFLWAIVLIVFFAEAMIRRQDSKS